MIRNMFPKNSILVFIVIAVFLLLTVGIVTLSWVIYRKSESLHNKLKNDIAPTIQDNTERISTDEETTDYPDSLASLFWTISIGDLNIELSRIGSGQIADTFWMKPILNTKTDNESFDSIFKEYFNKDSLVYNTGKNQIYWLNPGGYFQLQVVSNADFIKLSQPKSEKFSDTEAGTTIITEIKEFELGYTIEPDQWKAIQYSTYYVLAPNTAESKDSSWIPDGLRVECYIPIQGTNLFLEYSAPMRPISTELNLCNMLSDMGVENVRKVTLSSEQSIEKVTSLKEVKKYLTQVPNGIISLDHEDETNFVIHVFEINESNTTATFNWFEVNKETGEISKLF